MKRFWRPVFLLCCATTLFASGRAEASSVGLVCQSSSRSEYSNYFVVLSEGQSPEDDFFSDEPLEPQRVSTLTGIHNLLFEHFFIEIDAQDLEIANQQREFYLVPPTTGEANRLRIQEKVNDREKADRRVVFQRLTSTGEVDLDFRQVPTLVLRTGPQDEGRYGKQPLPILFHPNASEHVGMIPLDRIAPLDACQVLSAEEITRVKDALQDADRLKQVLSEILPWQKPEDAPTETPVQRAPGGDTAFSSEPFCVDPAHGLDLSINTGSLPEAELHKLFENIAE